MQRIIRPVHNQESKYDVYVKIEYNKDTLSITGVAGPMSNGRCKGSCGQCIDELRAGSPSQGWDKAMIEKLIEIWEEWHLNDLRPYCEHQKELGWDKLAKESFIIYHFCLKQQAMKEKKEAEAESLKALRGREIFYPTEDQAFFGGLEYFISHHEENLPRNIQVCYEPSKTKPKERKIAGWVYPKEHPKGLLTKRCPVCGYKYGTEWKQEKVPKEVIEWLFSLPKSPSKPAWI